MPYGALRRVFPFACAGAIGFMVDAAILYLSAAFLGPIGGRVVSWSCAVVTTWLINRRFAFADKASSSKLGSEFARYLVAMIPGGFTNWIGYGLALILLPEGDWQLLVATAVGSLAGMTTNLLMANYLVFTSKG